VVLTRYNNFLWSWLDVIIICGLDSWNVLNGPLTAHLDFVHVAFYISGFPYFTLLSSFFLSHCRRCELVIRARVCVCAKLGSSREYLCHNCIGDVTYYFLRLIEWQRSLVRWISLVYIMWNVIHSMLSVLLKTPMWVYCVIVYVIYIDYNSFKLLLAVILFAIKLFIVCRLSKERAIIFVLMYN